MDVMVKKYRVGLTGEEQEELRALVSKGRAAAYKQTHAQTHARILLLSFSAAYLQESGNRWFQEIEGRQFGKRGISSGPTSVIFDPRSGNVVAALGTQGVVVGTSDGRWIPAAVDSYAPTDFSLSRKFGALQCRKWISGRVLIFPLSMSHRRISADY